MISPSVAPELPNRGNLEKSSNCNSKTKVLPTHSNYTKRLVASARINGTLWYTPNTILLYAWTTGVDKFKILKSYIIH